jgi:predicted dehydrogenase
MQQSAEFDRRQFLQRTAGAVGAACVLPASALGKEGAVAPSDRLTLAQIGTGMMGTGDLGIMRRFPEVQMVAVCDVDRRSKNVNNQTYGREPARALVEKYYGERKASGAYKGCNAYVDYRELLEKEKDLDAVLVSTPDHTHAVISIAAMKKGKHVFCQKPLATSAWEARRMAEVARQMKVATQCGTGNYTMEGVLRMREMIDAGAIGAVREIHNWSNRPTWPQGMDRPKEAPPVPDGLDWNLWLGPARERPYHPAYLPFVWRGWLDFGCGALGDMGCYSFDVIFRALNLKHPTKVEACGSRLHGFDNRESFSQSSIVRYHFPARGKMPPVKLTWYDGGLLPGRPQELEDDRSLWVDRSGGLLFIGDKGKLLCGFNGDSPRLIPESRMKDYQPPPKTLPRSIGHKEEWIRACKGGEPAGANFEVASVVAETLAVGNAALWARELVCWDGPNLKITNLAGENPFVRRAYRNGWSLDV